MKIESPDHKNQAKTFKNQDQCFGAAVSGATYRISHIYLYNKEKTCFLSVRQHFTFSTISRKVL